MLSGGLRILSHALISSSKCLLWFVPRTHGYHGTWGGYNMFHLDDLRMAFLAQSNSENHLGAQFKLDHRWLHISPNSTSKLLTLSWTCGAGTARERGNSFSAPFFVADKARNPHLRSFWNHFLASDHGIGSSFWDHAESGFIQTSELRFLSTQPGYKLCLWQVGVTTIHPCDEDFWHFWKICTWSVQRTCPNPDNKKKHKKNMEKINAKWSIDWIYQIIIRIIKKNGFNG